MPHDLEGLEVFVVVAVDGAIQPGQPVAQGRLESDLVGVQGLFLERRLLLEVRDHSHTITDGDVQGRVEPGAFHPTVVAGVQEQIVVGPPVKLQLGRPEVVIERARERADGLRVVVRVDVDDIRFAIAEGGSRHVATKFIA